MATVTDCGPSSGGGYVPYDVAAGECRIAMRRTSPDGISWSEAPPVMMPDWRDHAADQIMELDYHPVGEGLIGTADPR